MRKQFTGKLNIFRAYQADTKYTATVDVEGQQFEYYPAPKCFKDQSDKLDRNRNIDVVFTANEDGSNPRC